MARGLGRAGAGAAAFDSAHRLEAGLRMAGQVAAVRVRRGAPDCGAGEVHRRDPERGFLPGRRLSMTATPRVGTGVRAGGELAVASMDDESVYGPVVYRYPFAAGIRDGWLKDYRLVVAAVVDAQARELLGDARLAEGGVPLAMAAAQAALAMAAAHHGLRRCVVFLPRVAHARLFAWTLPRILDMLPPDRRPAGPLAAGFVHGDMTALQRNLALAPLRDPPQGGWAVIANARCLGEGVDIPAIDSVLFAAPKESVIDIVQAVGRALRPHGDVDVATIIVPALCPTTRTAARHGGRPLGADAERGPRARRARRDLTAALAAPAPAAPPPPASRPGRSCPAGSSCRRRPAPSQDPAALSIRMIDRTTSPWWDGYGHAQAYHARHGTLDVPSRTSPTTGTPSGTGWSGSGPPATGAIPPPTGPGCWTRSA